MTRVVSGNDASACGRDAVRTASKVERKTPSAVSDGHESHRSEGTFVKRRERASSSILLIMEASRLISASCLWTISSFAEMNFFIFDTSFRVVSYLRVETVATRPQLSHATWRRSDDHEDGVAVASRRDDAIFPKFKLSIGRRVSTAYRFSCARNLFSRARRPCH